MDQDRQIRFLIPPFFLYGSFLWWAYIDPYLHCFLVGLAGAGLREIVPLIAAAGAATIPLGFLLGGFTLLILKARFRYRSRRWRQTQLYDACVSNECLDSIWQKIESSDSSGRDRRIDILYAVATFDHELLKPAIHKWVERRWNSFNVAANSGMAITISLVLAAAIRRYTFGLLTPIVAGARHSGSR